MNTSPATGSSKVEVASGTWNLDPAHTAVQFAATHMGIHRIRGRFTGFEGSIQIENGSVEDLTATGAVDVASLVTYDEGRDAHLVSGDFFDAESFPQISFTSKRVEAGDGPAFRVIGDLTIRDNTREIAFDAEVRGTGRDPYGNDRLSVQATGRIERKQFGLLWDERIESGEPVVSPEIEIELDLSAVKAD